MGQFWYKDDASSYPGSKDFFKFTKSKNSRCKLKVFPNKFTFGENKRFWAQKWCVALPLGLSVIQWKKSNGTSNLYIVDRGFLPPPPSYFMKALPYIACPSFSNFVNPHSLQPSALFVGLFLWLNVVFYAARNQVYWRCDTDDMAFGSLLIWDHGLKQTHTGETGIGILAHT